MTEVAEEIEQEEGNTEALVVEEPSNPLEMSDEDFAKQELPEDTVVENKEEVIVKEEEQEDSSDTNNNVIADTDNSDNINTTSSNEITTETSDKEVQKTGSTKNVKSNKEDTLNYEQEYKKLLTPFKANGKDMQIDSVDDAITLMQMGANYSKKMEGLKPNLKFIKMLQKNDLLDETKLSHLIDLSKKDTKAIKQLVKDSEIDPRELDEDEEIDYQPSNYAIQDQEVELDTVLDEIRDSSSYSETIDIVGNKWDAKSKQALLAAPQIISVINDHVATGIYGQITKIVEHEKMLGRLAGLSDLEAYKQVGDVLQAKGAFNQPQADEPNVTETRSPKANGSSQSPKVKAQKKAVSAPKAVASKPQDFKSNPLNMSDDDFGKIAGLDF